MSRVTIQYSTRVTSGSASPPSSRHHGARPAGAPRSRVRVQGGPGRAELFRIAYMLVLYTELQRDSQSHYSTIVYTDPSWYTYLYMSACPPGRTVQGATANNYKTKRGCTTQAPRSHDT